MAHVGLFEVSSCRQYLYVAGNHAKFPVTHRERTCMPHQLAYIDHGCAGEDSSALDSHIVSPSPGRPGKHRRRVIRFADTGDSIGASFNVPIQSKKCGDGCRSKLQGRGSQYLCARSFYNQDDIAVHGCLDPNNLGGILVPGCMSIPDKGRYKEFSDAGGFLNVRSYLKSCKALPSMEELETIPRRNQAWSKKLGRILKHLGVKVHRHKIWQNDYLVGLVRANSPGVGLKYFKSDLALVHNVSDMFLAPPMVVSYNCSDHPSKAPMNLPVAMLQCFKEKEEAALPIFKHLTILDFGASQLLSAYELCGILLEAHWYIHGCA